MAANEILCTKDYEVFKPHPMQRKIKPTLVLKLMKSMRKRGFVPSQPVTVNSKMQVVDGQNRLQAAKNLGLCVYYVVNDELDVTDIREMAVAHATWNIEDFITSQIRQGHESYVRLMALKELSGLNWVSFLWAAFDDPAVTTAQVKAGTFSLSDRREAQFMEFLMMFQLFKPSFKFWYHRTFVAACARMFRHPDYNHSQMQARYAYQSARLVRCATIGQYLMVLNDIYNYKSHEHNVVDLTKERRVPKGE